MKKAAVLLAQKKFSVSEVMYMVGYTNASYFSRCFVAEFNMTPQAIYAIGYSLIFSPFIDTNRTEYCEIGILSDLCSSLSFSNPTIFCMCANIAEKYFVKLKCISHETKELLKKAICSVPIVVVRSILLLCIYLSLGLVAVLQRNKRKITVSGIVTDSSGEPVIGASITEKGTSNGTISDVKGHFGISVSSTAIFADFLYRI